MSFRGLNEFIRELEKRSELARIKAEVNPVLEITEIADRVFKSGGKALLFENTGTRFPVLINAFGSENRMAAALGVDDLGRAGDKLFEAFNSLQSANNSLGATVRRLPALMNLLRIMPVRSSRKGKCQEIVIHKPDLSELPVLKCWPYDGGRFITLPMVHTVNPETLKTNVGMYRMQVLGEAETAMHWQLHKTGASHFRAWGKTGRRMPVTVTLGGDPVYTYAATAPLPENIDEYILAGFLRKKRVKLVKCITNDLYVPEDADIVLEGFVDPGEEMVWEGPFGDHTGFYSLEDWYPRFHVTCITHSRGAVYPATIVGIPPMEDSFMARATEKIFLAPLKFTLQPELEDLHMPDAGVAHNLAIIKINKSYPGQGKKVISALMGAGQMMFTKYMIAVSGDVNIRNYAELYAKVINNTDFSSDLLRITGPLDVLDHSSDNFAFGGKLGIDATDKNIQELNGRKTTNLQVFNNEGDAEFLNRVSSLCSSLKHHADLSLVVARLNVAGERGIASRFLQSAGTPSKDSSIRLVLMTDDFAETDDIFIPVWQALGNSDPLRDIQIAGSNTLIIDGTSKIYRSEGFKRRWPAPVCSDRQTIDRVDNLWESLGLGPVLESPSGIFTNSAVSSGSEIIIDGEKI